MKKKFITAVFVLLSYAMMASQTFASEYVLPYPSSMPGSKFYPLSEWWDEMQQYWYFGEIGGIKYHRAMSDKYLVQAKTLFEYQQYKLATQAMLKSDEHFSRAVVFMIDVTNAHKDDGSQQTILKQSAEKHTEIIKQLDEDLPDEITWQEEKKDKEDIRLDMLFTQAKTVRNYANR